MNEQDFSPPPPAGPHIFTEPFSSLNIFEYKSFSLSKLSL